MKYLFKNINPVKVIYLFHDQFIKINLKIIAK